MNFTPTRRHLAEINSIITILRKMHSLCIASAASTAPEGWDISNWYFALLKSSGQPGMSYTQWLCNNGFIAPHQARDGIMFDERYIDAQIRWAFWMREEIRKKLMS